MAKRRGVDGEAEMYELIGWFAVFWLIGYVVNAIIQRWDEARCRSHWEFNLEIHKRTLDRNPRGLFAAYHRWRIRVLTARLANYWQKLRQAAQNTQPLAPPPENTEYERLC